jgi:hypothetical protein
MFSASSGHRRVNLGFKHFMISLVSVRHVILLCIFIDKNAFIFDQGCIFLIRNKNYDFKMSPLEFSHAKCESNFVNHAFIFDYSGTETFLGSEIRNRILNFMIS